MHLQTLEEGEMSSLFVGPGSAKIGNGRLKTRIDWACALSLGSMPLWLQQAVPSPQNVLLRYKLCHYRSAREDEGFWNCHVGWLNIHIHITIHTCMHTYIHTYIQMQYLYVYTSYLKIYSTCICTYKVYKFEIAVTNWRYINDTGGGN